MREERGERLGCPWQRVLEPTTGYPYYWNTVTHVTQYEVPPDYGPQPDESLRSNVMEGRRRCYLPTLVSVENDRRWALCEDEVMRLEVEGQEMSDEEREMRDEREREEKEVQLFGCASTRC